MRAASNPGLAILVAAALALPGVWGAAWQPSAGSPGNKSLLQDLHAPMWISCVPSQDCFSGMHHLQHAFSESGSLGWISWLQKQKAPLGKLAKLWPPALAAPGRKRAAGNGWGQKASAERRLHDHGQKAMQGAATQVLIVLTFLTPSCWHGPTPNYTRLLANRGHLRNIWAYLGYIPASCLTLAGGAACRVCVCAFC